MRFTVPYQLVRRRDEEHERITLSPSVESALGRLCDDSDDGVADFARRWRDGGAIVIAH